MYGVCATSLKEAPLFREGIDVAASLVVYRLTVVGLGQEIGPVHGTWCDVICSSDSLLVSPSGVDNYTVNKC